MTIDKSTPIPDMAAYLLPATARFLDDQEPELQVLTLVGLREWLMKKQHEIPDDPAVFANTVDHFVRGFVMAYKGDTYA